MCFGQTFNRIHTAIRTSGESVDSWADNKISAGQSEFGESFMAQIVGGVTNATETNWREVFESLIALVKSSELALALLRTYNKPVLRALLQTQEEVDGYDGIDSNCDPILE